MLDQVLALTRHKMQSKAAMQAQNCAKLYQSVESMLQMIEGLVHERIFFHIYLLMHLTT